MEKHSLYLQREALGWPCGLAQGCGLLTQKSSPQQKFVWGEANGLPIRTAYGRDPFHPQSEIQVGAGVSKAFVQENPGQISSPVLWPSLHPEDMKWVG